MLAIGKAAFLAALDSANLGLFLSPGSQTHQAFHNPEHLSAEPLATWLQKAAAEVGSEASGMTVAGIYLFNHRHEGSLDLCSPFTFSVFAVLHIFSKSAAEAAIQ